MKLGMSVRAQTQMELELRSTQMRTARAENRASHGGEAVKMTK